MIRYMLPLSMMLVGLVLAGCSGNEPAKPTPGQASDAVVKDAQAVVAQVTDLIKAKKLNEAETKLKTLETKSATLPKDLQDKIKTARESLDAAKVAAGKLPALPK